MTRRQCAARETIQFIHPRRALVLCASLVLLAGCRQDMQDQPKFFPQRGTSFYADGRSVRPQVTGTVARSQGTELDYVHTGLVEGKEADGLPIPLTTETIARGQERYNVYCAPCHSRVGNGAGRIVERGYYPAASFHSTRLREAPLGHFFSVMTKGYGAMPDYAVQLTPEDRWAIAAYIRALQLSQNAKQEDVASGEKADTLQNVAAKQGFPREFLEAWYPPSHAHAAAPVAAVTPATPVPVKGNAQPTLPSKVATEVLTKATTASAPAAAPVKKESVATVHDADAGKMVYMRNCAACHQISRAGLPPNIPSLIGIVPKVGETRIRMVIADGISTGKPPMPSFASRLSAEDIDNLIAFLQASK